MGLEVGVGVVVNVVLLLPTLPPYLPPRAAADVDAGVVEVVPEGAASPRCAPVDAASSNSFTFPCNSSSPLLVSFFQMLWGIDAGFSVPCKGFEYIRLP